MGLIKEPRNVDFYVIDKEWSDLEQKEFSELINNRKVLLQKSKFKPFTPSKTPALNTD